MEESIVLGGGCFWCIDALYSNVVGVTNTTSGYAGNGQENPTYEQVSSGKTGHAEVVKITFDTNVINLQTILEIFLAIHDPTTKNRQGDDIGSQYRSIILYTNDRQKVVALKSLEAMQNFWKGKIVTEVAKLRAFYPAEDYHQDFYTKNPENAYCQTVINPKLAQFRRDFANLLKSNTIR